MPFDSQFSLSLELNRLIPTLSSTPQIQGLIKLARNLQVCSKVHYVSYCTLESLKLFPPHQGTDENVFRAQDPTLSSRRTSQRSSDEAASIHNSLRPSDRQLPKLRPENYVKALLWKAGLVPL
jgi:hypothetical protein